MPKTSPTASAKVKQSMKNLEKFFTKKKLGRDKWMRELLTQYFHFITAFKDQGKVNAACRQFAMVYLGEGDSGYEGFDEICQKVGVDGCLNSHMDALTDIIRTEVAGLKSALYSEHEPEINDWSIANEISTDEVEVCDYEMDGDEFIGTYQIQKKCTYSIVAGSIAGEEGNLHFVKDHFGVLKVSGSPGKAKKFKVKTGGLYWECSHWAWGLFASEEAIPTCAELEIYAIDLPESHPGRAACEKEY